MNIISDNTEEKVVFVIHTQKYIINNTNKNTDKSNDNNILAMSLQILR